MKHTMHEVVEPTGDSRGFYEGFHAAVLASKSGDAIIKFVPSKGVLVAEWTVNEDGTVSKLKARG